MPRKRTKVINAIIDSIFHPHFKEDPSLIFWDWFCHSLVEGKFDVSQLVRYNLKHLIKASRKKNR